MSFEEQEYSKRIDISVWKRLLRFATPHRKKIVTLIIQMVMIGLVDAAFPQFNRFAVDNVALAGRFDLLLPMSLVALVLITFQAINVRYMILNAGHVEINVPYDIRKTAFEKLQTLPLAYYDKTPVGWIMARLTSDCRKLGQTLSWNLVDLFWSLSNMIIAAIAMLLTNWRLALFVLVTVPPLILVSLEFQKRILGNFRKVRRLNSQVTAKFNEGITGAKTIKSLSVEAPMLKEFSGTTGEMRNFAVKAATINSFYTPIIMLLGSIASGLVFWQGGMAMKNGSLGVSYGVLVAFISYAVNFFEPVKQFARVFTELNYAQASAERVMSLLDVEADIGDSEKVSTDYGGMFTADRSNWPAFNGEIEFRDVTFRYKAGENILSHFNLKVKSGETLAIVGETGSGKTTMVNLACRFYEPTEGSILVDGVDYRERPLMWMYTNLGYVLQEPHLFSGTVKENIAYGRQNATDEDIERAAKLVNAHDFIVKLEKGYESEVGENGSRLSTGQKQLISFARAILADPGMFVLDEATSSVDTETEALIQDAMHKALRGRTSFLIAHRLSTIRSADRILVIEKGKIVEEGTHKDLIRQRGHYWQLYTNQFMQEQEAKLVDA